MTVINNQAQQQAWLSVHGLVRPSLALQCSCRQRGWLDGCVCVMPLQITLWSQLPSLLCTTGGPNYRLWFTKIDLIVIGKIKYSNFLHRWYPLGATSQHRHQSSNWRSTRSDSINVTQAESNLKFQVAFMQSVQHISRTYVSYFTRPVFIVKYLCNFPLYMGYSRPIQFQCTACELSEACSTCNHRGSRGSTQYTNG